MKALGYDAVYRNEARAAIAEMREPTKAMSDAVFAEEERIGCIAAAFEHIDWDRAWPVAIDAALAEGQEVKPDV